MTVQPIAPYCFVNSSPRPEFAPVINAVSALTVAVAAPSPNATIRRASASQVLVVEPMLASPSECGHGSTGTGGQVASGGVRARAVIRSSQPSAQPVVRRRDEHAGAARLAEDARVRSARLRAIVVAGNELAVVDPELALQQVQLL